jgi:Arc/MetJ-type ribon-helix-helix transcriptional regulator
MVRTQIYLTEAQQKGLRRLAVRERKKQSELVRQAIDEFLADSTQEDHLTLLRQGRGLWRDRQDLPDFAALRHEASREQRR